VKLNTHSTGLQDNADYRADTKALFEVNSHFVKKKIPALLYPEGS